MDAHILSFTWICSQIYSHVRHTQYLTWTHILTNSLVNTLTHDFTFSFNTLTHVDTLTHFHTWTCWYFHTERLIHSHSLTREWAHTQTYLHIHWNKCVHTYSYNLPRCQVHTLTWVIIDPCTCTLTQSHTKTCSHVVRHSDPHSVTCTQIGSYTFLPTHLFTYMNTLKISVIHSFPLAHECTPTDNHSHMNTLMHSVTHRSTFIHSFTQVNILTLTCLDVQTCTHIQSHLDTLTSNHRMLTQSCKLRHWH